MSAQRVLLVNGSALLRGILRRVFEKSPGFLVVGEVDDLGANPEVIFDSHPDWIVVSIQPGGHLPLYIRELIVTQFPTIRILGVSTDGSEVIIDWVGVHERGYHGLSLDRLQQIMNEDFPVFGENSQPDQA